MRQQVWKRIRGALSCSALPAAKKRFFT